MIFVTCIYCDELKLFAIGETAGRWAYITCDACKRPQWLYISRINPHSITEEAFNATYDIKGHVVCERNPPPPLSPSAQVIFDMINRIMPQIIVQEIIGGLSDSDTVEHKRQPIADVLQKFPDKKRNADD